MLLGAMDGRARREMDPDHYSYLIDRQHRFLLIGIVLFVIAAVFTLTGESLERGGLMVTRAEEPKRFWWNVAMFFVGGIFFIALYLYNKSN
jgi:hypothetical protein